MKNATDDTKAVPAPCGLTESDTLEDALNRADYLATPDSYSGMLITNKDMRRIVRLAYEYRKLKALNK